MQHLDADPQGLSIDGQGLGQCTAVPGGGGCAPAGADPISAAVAGSFSVWEAGLEALVAHSQAVRVAGGLAVARTAAVLEGTDEAGGATISSLTATPPTAPDAALPGAGVPAPPALPVAPTVPVPEAVSGETWSAQIHTGAGPAHLAAYAARMRVTSSDLAAAAAELRGHAHAIDTHWDDGTQRAGANVARLADWYDDTAAYARAVATAAERSADHVRDAVAGTPRPETFAQLQAQVHDGLARFTRSGGLDVVPLQVATTKMAEAQRNAIDAQVGYAAAANTTTGGVPQPPKPAPPIVGAPAAAKKVGTNDQSSPDSDEATGTDDSDGVAKDRTAAADEGTDSGAQDDAETGAGDPARDGAAAANPDLGSSTAPEPPARPAVDPNVFSAPAATTGTTAGQILSGLTQAAGGMSPGMGGGATSPMSALAGLSGLPGSFGGASMTGAPDMSGGSPEMSSPDDLGLNDGGGAPMDAGAADTTASGGGDMGASLPSGTTAALPAAAPASPAVGALPGPAGNTPAHSAGTMMGGGMMPPIAGPGPGAQNGERDKSLYPDKRVVHREVPNTEPVFGELERDRRRSPRQRPTPDQEEPAHGTTG